MINRRLINSLIISFGVIGAGTASANDWPSKPIRIVVPFNSGTGSDTDARFYSDLISKKLNTAVIVENKPGGNGVIAVQAVKSSPADGYSILLASNSPMSVNPALTKNLPYDPFKDFKPLVGLAKSNAIFLVGQSSPYNSMAEVIEKYKSQAADIAIGNYSPGYQLIASWFGDVANVKVNHINYKGGAQIATDIIGGQLEMGIAEPTSFIDMHKTGKVKILASTGEQRHLQLPEVPTMKELGFKDFESSVWSSFFIRSETPDDITEKLLTALKEMVNSPEAQEFRAKRFLVPLALHGNDLRKFQVEEYERFKHIAEKAGLRN